MGTFADGAVHRLLHRFQRFHHKDAHSQYQRRLHRKPDGNKRAANGVRRGEQLAPARKQMAVDIQRVRNALTAFKHLRRTEEDDTACEQQIGNSGLENAPHRREMIQRIMPRQFTPRVLRGLAHAQVNAVGRPHTTIDRGGTVPQTAYKENNKLVYVLPRLATAVAAQRNVQVITEPACQG